MTRWEMLEALAAPGGDSDYNDGLGGYLNWSIFFSNGNCVLNVRFEDSETDEVSEFEWVLTPREVK